MRVLLLLVAFCSALSAQSIEVLHDLRRDAERDIEAKKYEDARVKLRDAALIGRSIEHPELEATCTLRLAQILRWSDTGIQDSEAAYRLAETALTVSTHAGLKQQELDALNILRPKSEDYWLASMDAALAYDAFDIIELAWRVENSLNPPNEEHLKTLTTGMELADRRARLRAMTNAGRPPESLTDDILKFASDARNAGFARIALAVLEDCRGLSVEVLASWQSQLQTTKRYRDNAQAVLEISPSSANPDDEGYESVVSALIRAFGHAGTARDLQLQVQLGTKIHAITGERRWSAITESLSDRVTWELIADGRRAVRDSFFLSDGLIEKLEAHGDNAEVHEILLLLRGEPKSRSDEDRKKYTDALRAALKDPNTRGAAAILAEIAMREEAFPVLVEELHEEGNAPALAWAIETLARQQDIETLIELLKHKDWEVVEAAAAAIFRLDATGLGFKITLAAANIPNNGAALYVSGTLAKFGTPNSLDSLEKEVREGNSGRRAIASGILASLGYATPVKTFRELLNEEKPSFVIPRVLARMPRTWGAELVYDSNSISSYHASRAAFRRTDPNRTRRIPARGLHANLYLLPEGVADGNLDMQLLSEAQSAEKSETRDLIAWAADRAGAQGNEVDNALAETEDETPLRRLARIERETSSRPEGNRKRLVIIDIDGDGFARCAIEYEVGTAQIVDNKIRIPYRMSHTFKAVGGGLAGQVYSKVTIPMAASNVRGKVFVVIPGYEPIEAVYGSGADGWGEVIAPLPIKTGEGLDDNTPAPLEEIVQGKLDVRFDFNGNPGQLEFPLRYVAPPEGDKPDLVPLALTIDPPVPEIGRSARVYLRVKNNGKAVGDVGFSSVRFMIKNPQSEDGWRTLDARPFSPRGWRPGEIRTFEVRPKFVEGYYMNTYSYTYTPALGDTVIRADVDPDNSVKEMDDENNAIEVDSPLRHDEQTGTALAEAEALEALKQPAEDLKNATTLEELDDAYGRAYSIFERLTNKTPAVEIMLRHLYSAYAMKEARMRADAALKDLRQAREDGTLDAIKARTIRSRLERAQEAYLNSGVPIKVETLEKCRNATLAAANLPAAVGDYAQLNYALNRYDSDESAAGNASRYLKALDGAMLAVTEMERARQRGEVDAGNLMDAASNAADALELKLPGFSNLHREILKAELEYADKGMRKEADAIEALTAVISGEEGAQERLNAAVGEVEQHVSAGPFTPDSIKNIFKGWVKDIPVVGQIADIIFSWK